MRNLLTVTLIFALPALIFACGGDKHGTTTEKVNNGGKVLSTEVVTADVQASLTAETVLQQLKDGNYRFIQNDLTPRDYAAQVAATASGQYPKAVILSCLDSRIPVEYVFDQGIGDVFVGRVAGNFVDEDMLGSMEFGCKVAGSKLILVMGHESCGAVKAAIDNVQLGNITAMLTKITPVVAATSDYAGEQTSKNPDYVTHVSVENVKHAIKSIREQSPILREMEENGEIMIVGALYDMDSGEVKFLD